MAIIYEDDIVCFKKNHNIIGRVSHSWRKDQDEPNIEYEDCYIPTSLSTEDARAFSKDSQSSRIPRKFVVIDFARVQDGQCLVAEDLLKLLDRDVEKASFIKLAPSDAQCGLVISKSIAYTIDPNFCNRNKTSRMCGESLRQTYKHRGTPRWPSQQGRLSDIKAAELVRSTDYMESDWITYKGWVGAVYDTVQEVTVELRDGGRVIPTDCSSLDEVDVPRKSPSYCLHAYLFRAGYRLPTSRDIRTCEVSEQLAGERCVIGQCVSMSRHSLSTGNWLRGKYHPQTESAGVVVDIRTTEIFVSWIAVPQLGMLPEMAPQGQLYTDDPAINRFIERDLQIGDIVDYRPSKTSPTPERYKILGAESVLEILWQDGSSRKYPSTAIIPFTGHDGFCFPGDLVSIVDSEQMSDTAEGSVLSCGQLAIVQSANQTENVVKVRKFDESHALVEGDTKSTLLAPVTTGSLRETVEEIPLLDVGDHKALALIEGQFVIIKSRHPGFVNFSTSNKPNEGVESQIAPEPNWFGQIIDQSIEGLIRVRLTGAQPPCEVLVPFADMIDPESLLGDSPSADMLDEPDNGNEDWGDVEMTSVWESASCSEELCSSSDNSDGPGGNNGESVSGQEATAVDEIDQAEAYVVPDKPSSDEHRISTQIPSDTDPDMPESYSVLDGLPDMIGSPLFDENKPQLTAAQLQRLFQEHKRLSDALPKGVFVRTWESRLDCFRVMILGPFDTPYEYAPLIFDLIVDSKFPTEPPKVHFHSWTNGKGRVNPNLYESGKVCLSLLGTWEGDTPESNWSRRSTILQIIVSIQGLILVKDPYFNEAGFESSNSHAELQSSASRYAENAFVLTRSFIVHALRAPTKGLEDVILSIYLKGPGVLDKVIDELKAVVEDSSERRTLTRGAKMSLKGPFEKLEEIKSEQVSQQSEA